MATIAETNSLFEIDAELDNLLDEIEEQTAQDGEPTGEIVARFQQFCSAHGEKVDRIGRFLRQMEAREQFCRAEASRLSDRARTTAGKAERTKNMVLYYLLSRDLKKIEGYQFTLRAQKNSQDSVRITDEAAVPKCYCRIDARIDGVVWETVLSLLPDELSKSLELSVQESLGNKRNELSDDHIKELVRLYAENHHDATSEVVIEGKSQQRICSKIFDNREFGFLKITVERRRGLGIDSRNIVKSTPDPTNLSILSQTGQSHIDGRSAGDVQEVLRREGLSIAEPLNPSKYLIAHGLHDLSGPHD